MSKKLYGLAATGARAMQIVAELHPDRFTVDQGNLFLDGLTIGDVFTEALDPETRNALLSKAVHEPEETHGPMTDERAAREMEFVKKTINRHADMGWLASYGHDFQEGFYYTYWDGRYEAIAEQEDAA